MEQVSQDPVVGTEVWPLAAESDSCFRARLPSDEVNW